MVASWAEWTLPQDSKSGQRDAGMDFFGGGGVWWELIHPSGQTSARGLWH